MNESKLSYLNSTAKIPFSSSAPVLATSTNYIFTDNTTKKQKQAVLIDQHFQHIFAPCSIHETIIDCLWYDDLQKVLLLTSTSILMYDFRVQSVKPLLDIKPTDNQLFKCFTTDSNQSTLLIAYDEWEAEFIERWERTSTDDNICWKLIRNYPLNLTSNEFIGSMTSVENNLAITICNHLTEQWRMELRELENFICLKKILLPSINLKHDYRIVYLKPKILNTNWLIFSPSNDKIIAIDSNWQKKCYQYRLPVHRMAQFQEDKIIIRTANRVDIHTIME
ncbi:unnamed protein product [Adineta ricciae]|uniref:Uncharacterized protein n=1 Tax=Adineta ricciae TaxID=249248 RepID=A0A814J5G7_ADIRI|nr:unnamed protein product [Adineta ricciae]CAF1049337.1 unnamed protein product [Adineta ricciae]